MAPPPKSLIFMILFTHTFHSVCRPESLSIDVAFLSDSPLQIELDSLRSRISILETKISEKVEELKIKDANVKRIEKNIEEKSTYIALLDLQIKGLQKGSPEAGELRTKMHARFNELSDQADNIRKETESQIKKKDALEMCIYGAEKKIRELNLKLLSLQKISDDQKTRISKIKHDIQFAEEKLIKLKIESSLVSEEMNQEAKQFLKPYLTQISVTLRPHFDKLSHALYYYKWEIVQTYRRCMISVMARHMQVQDTVIELLKGHEYTKPFSDKNIVCYMASAIFALPAILVFNLYTSLVSKPQKRRHNDHARRRAKRLRQGSMQPKIT